MIWDVAKLMTIHAVLPSSNINKNEKKKNITQNPPTSVEVEMFFHARLAAVMHLLRREPD